MNETTAIYWAHHYADENPRQVSALKIMGWAQDEGYIGDSIDEAIKYLNDLGDVNIWIEE